MLIIENNYRVHLVQALETALRELPNVSVRSRQIAPPPVNEPKNELKYDAVLEIEVAGRLATLFVQTKKAIFPRDVRQLVWEVHHHATPFPFSAVSNQQSVPFIAAKSISAGAKDLLRSERLGYYEEGGSLYVPADGLYILLDRPPSKATSKTNRALFSGRRSQVIHSLLRKPNQWRSVKELAEEAVVSSATAYQVLTQLEKFDWLSSRGSGPHKERMLIEPRSLLDAWVRHVTALPKPLVRRFYVPSVKPEELLSRIDQVCSARNAAYAITQEWAGQLYSPFLSSISQVRCRVLADQSVKELASALNAREVQEGSNLGVIESKSYGDFLFRERQQNVWLASPILVYLDLLQGDGRAKEMAEHLRRERIKF